MIEKTCRCGASKKNFQIDIGPFFVDECCLAAGFDELGNKLEPKDIGLTPEEVEAATNPEVTSTLEVVDEGEQEDPEEANISAPEGTDLDAQDQKPEETKAEEKPKRKYNRGGNIKKES